MMDSLAIYRVTGGNLMPVGSINRQHPENPIFTYREDYLDLGMELSISLPLRHEPFAQREFRPYFEGLLPEGRTRGALATSIGAREDDYLTLLASSGLDCIGDVVVREESEGTEWDGGGYESLEKDGLASLFQSLTSLAESNVASRLSLAGTQGKVGLAHMPAEPPSDGWMRPIGGAASTHILKTSSLSRIEELELLCMAAAELCGLRTAHCDALMLGAPVIVSERYDRTITTGEQGIHVTRLHQEDLAQAFGVSSAAKYLELPGGSYHSIAQLLYERSSSVLTDLDHLARITVFNYLIGNCDNHLKNLSIVHHGAHIRLAPAYDLVCTTYFERFSREMGMRLGSTRLIDDITLDDFDLLARDLGMGARRMRSICTELSERIAPAIIDAGERFAPAIDALPYTAKDLIDNLGPRLAIIQ